MNGVDWSSVWRDVAGRMAGHREAGRTHLLTEDVLRFETVLALADCGVPADRLRVEVFASALTGGKLDLVVDPPHGTVIEFKFPRDSSTGISPDTMTLGELLRDFFRVAAVPAEERWVVQLLNARLSRYLQGAYARYGLTWVDTPGQILQLAAKAVAALPGTARRAMGDVLADGGLTATCELAASVGSDLRLLAYRVDARGQDMASMQLASLQPPPAAPVPHPAEARERDGARREILAAARAVVERSGFAEFTIADVLLEMRRRGTRYAEATIRTMISSHLCAESLGHGIAGHADLSRVGRGTYRLTSAST